MTIRAANGLDGAAGETTGLREQLAHGQAHGLTAVALVKGAGQAPYVQEGTTEQMGLLTTVHHRQRPRWQLHLPKPNCTTMRALPRPHRLNRAQSRPCLRLQLMARALGTLTRGTRRRASCQLRRLPRGRTHGPMGPQHRTPSRR